MSQISTHILDTSIGKPARGVSVTLEKMAEDYQWQFLSNNLTNEDGRISGLLPSRETLEPGIYRLRFNTRKYFSAFNKKSFYPFVDLIFEISKVEHYHVPLLLNPFGYTTYRGS